MQRATMLNTDRPPWTPQQLLERWQRHLQEHDHEIGPSKSKLRQKQNSPLTLAMLTPIVFIGYRNELQHAQHKAISTVNLRISALRA